MGRPGFLQRCYDKQSGAFHNAHHQLYHYQNLHHLWQRHDSTTVLEEAGLSFIFNAPAYDAGQAAVSILDTLYSDAYSIIPIKSMFYKYIMYAGIPLSNPDADWLSSELKIKIRVSKPYERYYSNIPLDTIYPGMDINGGFPMYTFSTKGIATGYDIVEESESQLDLINVVPNPYYAYSTYEPFALDTRVKITNIPKQCTITIFDVAGTKIRQFKVDVGGVQPVQFGNNISKQDYMQETTAIEWDIKNFAGVPISGGVYYIHVKSPIGEKVIKWFCMQRTPDLNTF